MHNGEIYVRSNPNKGTTFIIKLAIRLVEDNERDSFIEDSSLKYISEMELSDIDKKA